MEETELTIRHVKAARALLGWSQDDLADRSGVSIQTVKRLEALGAGKVGGLEETRDKIAAALVKAGIVFENGDAPGVRLKRRRA